ncbi:hypothetical protein MUK42_16387 [Musa troglodytarum]|uniref:Cytochrome c oxidase assembly factor 3 mitochondrial coiled-coil domain-containing protein n=2 Tax=Musa TaxID=4640 RepID=A0A9E7KW68_9LILI|nr:hypothetical protein MUK42_16387 [Musa troglodytarum]
MGSAQIARLGPTYRLDRVRSNRINECSHAHPEPPPEHARTRRDNPRKPNRANGDSSSASANDCVFLHRSRRRIPSSCNAARLATMKGFSSLAPKTKNLIVAGGLSGFVLGVYYYTMRAVGGTDELQVAIDKFEQMKNK